MHFHNYVDFLQNTGWVWLVNVMFTFLAMFHLAYLGLMFKSEPNMQEFDYQVITACTYTCIVSAKLHKNIVVQRMLVDWLLYTANQPGLADNTSWS